MQHYLCSVEHFTSILPPSNSTPKMKVYVHGDPKTRPLRQIGSGEDMGS